MSSRDSKAMKERDFLWFRQSLLTCSRHKLWFVSIHRKFGRWITRFLLERWMSSPRHGTVPPEMSPLFPLHCGFKIEELSQVGQEAQHCDKEPTTTFTKQENKEGRPPYHNTTGTTRQRTPKLPRFLHRSWRPLPPRPSLTTASTQPAFVRCSVGIAPLNTKSSHLD